MPMYVHGVPEFDVGSHPLSSITEAGFSIDPEFTDMLACSGDILPPMSDARFRGGFPGPPNIT